MGTNASKPFGVPLISVVLPVAFFYLLTHLAHPPWHGIDSSVSGYLLLSLAHGLPLLVLAAPHHPRSAGLFGALIAASLAGVFLCFHGGVSSFVVYDLDTGDIVGRDTIKAALGVFTGVLAVPAGLAIAEAKPRGRLTFYVALAAATGFLGQLTSFLAVRAWEGATGFDLWMESRTAIHTAFGMVAGLFVGAAKLYRPLANFSALGEFSWLPFKRLPGAGMVALTIVVLSIGFGVLRISVELRDRARFVDTRLDSYFLALTNLRRAQLEDLAYPELSFELRRAARALEGSVSFDKKLAGLVGPLIASIERIDKPDNPGEFRDATMALNRRLLALGEPYFLEPQVLVQKPLPIRYLLRYRVTGQVRYRLEGGGSVPILRIRRIDLTPVDTPYTGLSYSGMGTVLMDHIDEVVLKSHGILFLKDGTDENPNDGRFATTRRMMRLDRVAALESALSSRGYRNRGALSALGAVGAKWSQVADVSNVRTEMDPVVQATYDALGELLARQIEVHEARHALDGKWDKSIPKLDELKAGRLASSAASEIRAYLTEMIDGPLGPHFALTTTTGLVAGPNARSNAYFFAGIVLLETLWGEPIRRPDIVEQETTNGPPTIVFAPISLEHPGWLSYSRIHGAYADLRSLSPEDLKQRARQAFKLLFGQEYKAVERQR